MVTETEWEKFCQELEKQESIYDLLVLMYRQIEGPYKKRYVKEYYESLRDIPNNYWGDLALLNNEMLEEVISFPLYLKKLKEYMNREKLRNVSVRMLLDFERYFEKREAYPALVLERQGFSGELYYFGPFNKVNTEYGFYLMPERHYFKDFNRVNNLGIRFMNQSEFTVIDEKIKRYKIIKKERLEKAIDIKYYAGTHNLNSRIKVGIIPVAPKLWCKDIYEEYPEGEKYYFRLEDIEERTQEINDAYIRILQRCIQEEIQIVIFPELAQNRETAKRIQDFLIQETLKRSHSLELIFLGSLWENGKNEGILFSGTGRLLLKSSKIYPFSIRRGGKEYWEDLKEEAQELELIDIPPLGRIQYLICKDGLNAGWQYQMRGIFEIALSFISSYSESVSHFENIGHGFSNEYAGIQVLANACAPRIGRDNEGQIKTDNMKEVDIAYQNEIGHMVVPCAESDRKAGASQKIRYTDIQHCKEKCCFGECIRVFQIDLSLITKKENILGNYVTTDCIII